MDQNSQAPDLPHIIVNEPKRSPWAVGGIVVLSLMVLAIPLGLFLVQQRTQLAPQAAVVEPSPEPATGILLESKLSPEAKGGVIPVDVYVKSSTDPINLASIKLKFNPALLSVDKIATNAAQLQKTELFSKWLEVSNDNNQGLITITAGLPTPGVRTADQPEGKVYLATINLRPKGTGTAVLQTTSGSLLLRNSDNQNLFQSGSDLILNLMGAAVGSSPQASNKPAANQPVIVITSPSTASNYSYFKPIDIIWSSFNVEVIPQLNLYLNGAFFGPISQNIDAKTGKFTWNPKDTLSLPYIQAGNTYEIEIVGIGKNSQSVKSIAGPFGILGQEEVTGATPNSQTFLANGLTVDDASRLLSNYLILPLADKSLDLNKDGAINELDFYLLKQNLSARGIIK